MCALIRNQSIQNPKSRAYQNIVEGNKWGETKTKMNTNTRLKYFQLIMCSCLMSSCAVLADSTNTKVRLSLEEKKWGKLT